MRPNQEKLVSVTTRIPPRDFIALSSKAKLNNETVSSHLRCLIASDVSDSTETVLEDDVRELLSKKSVARRKRSIFNRILRDLFG